VPYVLVVGGKEESSATVAVRDRPGKVARSVPVEPFIAGALVENQEGALETVDVADF
jgi:threonyl-tRNA synthetase